MSDLEWPGPRGSLTTIRRFGEARATAEKSQTLRLDMELFLVYNPKSRIPEDLGGTTPPLVGLSLATNPSNFGPWDLLLVCSPESQSTRSVF